MTPALAGATRWLLLFVIVLGFALRVHRIDEKGLWLDEAFSVWMAQHTLPELIDWLVRIDQHPPLYYMVLHWWLWFGESAAHVRMLSVMFGVFTLPVIFLIGRRLSGNVVGLVAAFILAISPFHVRFAQEARMYTLLMLNAGLATLALVYLFTEPHTSSAPIGRQLAEFFQNRRVASAQKQVNSRHKHKVALGAIRTDLAWLAYMLFTTLTVLTHNTAVFFPVAVNLFVVGWMLQKKFSRDSSANTSKKTSAQALPLRSGASIVPSSPYNSTALFASLPSFSPPSLSNWVIAQAGAFLLWSPWLAPFVIQSIGVYAEFWIPAPTLWTVIGAMQNLLSAFWPHHGIAGVSVWSVYALLIALGFNHLRRRPTIAFFMLTLLLTPFIGEWLVSLRRPIFYDRTLIWTTIPLYLLLAFGLMQLRFRSSIFLIGVVVLAMIQSASLREYYDNFQKEQWREAAAYVARHVQDGDLILFNATWVQIPFDFYYKAYNLPTERRGVPVDLFDRGVLEPKMMEADLPRLRSLVQNRKRVWLVYSHDWYTDPQKLIPRALEETFRLLDRRLFYGVDLRLYGAP
ncbi:MAG: glycosyltransferase family 39 protein [Caldilinea sp.]|nr:glycosyltransferase family 39 protein [Caldilinea sp.]MDW8441262.1 glycosyltransferase family 39 protein [Caldilineaceae bacterium]